MPGVVLRQWMVYPYLDFRRHGIPYEGPHGETVQSIKDGQIGYL
jgi:hypothetical protein